jgi:predicted PurR-regulated permease PerM
MKVSASLLVPFLLSVFIAVLSLPAMNALERFGLSAGVSLLTVIPGVFVAGLMLSLLIGNSIGEFSRSLPQYQQQITVYQNQLIGQPEHIGVEMPESIGSDMLDPNVAMRLLSSVFRSFGSVLTNAL